MRLTPTLPSLKIFFLSRYNIKDIKGLYIYILSRNMIMVSHLVKFGEKRKNWNKVYQKEVELLKVSIFSVFRSLHQKCISTGSIKLEKESDFIIEPGELSQKTTKFQYCWKIFERKMTVRWNKEFVEKKRDLGVRVLCIEFVIFCFQHHISKFQTLRNQILCLLQIW